MTTRIDFDRLGDPIVVASFPRSGTHLTIDLLRRQFPECRASKRLGESIHSVYLNLDLLHNDAKDGLPEGRAFEICKRSARPIIKTHSFPDLSWAPASWRDWISSRGCVLYVQRDGRKVLTSYYQLAEQEFEAARCSFAEFLRLREGFFLPGEHHEHSIPRLWRRHCTAWLRYAGATRVDYENILSSPQEQIQRIAAALKLTPQRLQDPLPPRVAGVWYGRFARFLSRSPTSTAILTRRGRHESLKWQDHFTPESLAFYEQEVNSTSE